MLPLKPVAGGEPRCPRALWDEDQRPPLRVPPREPSLRLRSELTSFARIIIHSRPNRATGGARIQRHGHGKGERRGQRGFSAISCLQPS